MLVIIIQIMESGSERAPYIISNIGKPQMLMSFMTCDLEAILGNVRWSWDKIYPMQWERSKNYLPNIFMNVIYGELNVSRCQPPIPICARKNAFRYQCIYNPLDPWRVGWWISLHQRGECTFCFLSGEKQWIGNALALSSRTKAKAPHWRRQKTHCLGWAPERLAPHPLALQVFHSWKKIKTLSISF